MRTHFSATAAGLLIFINLSSLASSNAEAKSAAPNASLAAGRKVIVDVQASGAKAVIARLAPAVDLYEAAYRDAGGMCERKFRKTVLKTPEQKTKALTHFASRLKTGSFDEADGVAVELDAKKREVGFSLSESCTRVASVRTNASGKVIAIFDDADPNELNSYAGPGLKAFALENP